MRFTARIIGLGLAAVVGWFFVGNSRRDPAVSSLSSAETVYVICLGLCITAQLLALRWEFVAADLTLCAITVTLLPSALFSDSLPGVPLSSVVVPALLSLAVHFLKKPQPEADAGERE